MNESIVNGSEVNMCSSQNACDLGSLSYKPRFLSSFLIDARGGSVHGSRHSGVHIVIPAGKVCMPTRITCKLIKSDKLSVPPPLREGEAVVSRIIELGPVGMQFNGPVLIELPHVASLHNNEREVVALRSDDGATWHEHSVSSSDIVSNLLKSPVNGESENAANKPTVSIVSTDFPRYFTVISRVRQVSRVIGEPGGSLVSELMANASASFPAGSVTKDTKVGLQVLPVPSETIEMVLGAEGQTYGTSPVITVEPRRRRFHAPISLTIPLPKITMRRSGKQQSDGLHLLYSISGGVNRSAWEDITGSAPLNVSKDFVSFSTTVSARFWLVDCGQAGASDSELLVASATNVYSEVIAVPMMAQFVVYARHHHEAEAQLRVLCVTSDVDTSTTLEHQEKFHEISRSQPVELLEGKSYCVEVGGNLVPTAASSSQLGIEFRAFRINRLSFIVRIRDVLHLPDASLKFLPAAKLPHGLDVQSSVPVCSMAVSLVEAKPAEFLVEHESEELVRKFEVAKQQVALSREQEQESGAGTGVTLRLGDIALALQSDWISLAKELNITDPEVIKIQKDFGNIVEQAMIMLHLWVAKAGRVNGNELETGLARIGRKDIINRCIRNVPNDDSAQLTNGTVHEGIVQPIDSPPDDPSSHRTFGVDSYILHENGHDATAEVEEGAVYQIEEVWDGNQWHKSRKLVPKQGEGPLEEGVSISVIENPADVPVPALQPAAAEPIELPQTSGTDVSEFNTAPVEEEGVEYRIEQAIVQSLPPEFSDAPCDSTFLENEGSAVTEEKAEDAIDNATSATLNEKPMESEKPTELEEPSTLPAATDADVVPNDATVTISLTTDDGTESLLVSTNDDAVPTAQQVTTGESVASDETTKQTIAAEPK